jgi:mono/diheme cytochrome c family protein
LLGRGVKKDPGRLRFPEADRSGSKRPLTIAGSAATAVAFASALALAAPMVLAQDALRGKRLYLDTARLTGSPVSCVDCHGGLPRGFFGIGRAANDPESVARALSTIPQMTPLRGRLSVDNIADLASYIGNPEVPSPLLRVIAQAPASSSTLLDSDRVQFGGARVGQRSLPAKVRLGNEGAIALRLDGAARIAGANAGDYLIATDGCAAGMLLSPGRWCEIAVVFQPTPGASGLRTAALQVDHDWAGAIVAVALLGTAE